MSKEDHRVWLQRAESNLKLAKEGRVEGYCLRTSVLRHNRRRKKL